TTRDQVEINIIDEGRKGFLSIFGSKPAIVRAFIVKNQIEETEKYIQEITKNMDVDVDITTTVKGNHVTFALNGEKIALLIVKRGKTINVLQYLVQLAFIKVGRHYLSDSFLSSEIT